MMLPFTVVPCAQRSPEWRRLRQTHFTATDAARLAGRKVSVDALLQEKRNTAPDPDLSKSPYIREGIFYEEKLRKFLARSYPYLLEPGMDDLPQYVAVSRDEPFFMASLDAYYVKGREVFEFKNVYSQNHERFADVMKNGLDSKAARDGNWYDQVQWQLICTHAVRARLYVHHYNPATREHELRLINIKPDPGRMRDLIVLGYEFKRAFLTPSASPPSSGANAYVYPREEVARYSAVIEKYRLALERGRQMQRDFNRCQDEIERLKGVLISALSKADYDTVIAGPVTITKSVRQGKIDPQLLLKDGLDVSKYRRQATVSVKVSLT